MDGISHYAGPAGALHVRPTPIGHSSAPWKTAADYLRALRRRFWLVLLVALLVALPGTHWVLRMPPVYRVAAQAFIEAPQFDPVLTGIVSNDLGRADPQTMAQYVPNRLAHLRSKSLAERVVADPRIAQGAAPAGDPAAELIAKLSTRQLVPNTGFYDVFLEGNDPARTTRLLNTLLELFEKDAKEENAMMLDVSRNHAERSLAKLQGDLRKLDFDIARMLQDSPIFAPGGKNILLDQWVAMTTVLQNKRFHHEDLLRERRMADIWPNARGMAPLTPAAAELAELRKVKRRYLDYAQYMQRIIPKGRFDHDPASVYITRKLADLMQQIQELEASQAEPPDLAAMSVRASQDELENLGKEVQDLLKRLQDSMPRYQEYLTALNNREQMVSRTGSLQARIENFGVLADANARKYPVKVTLWATEPAAPARPNRPLLIAVVACLGLALGCALVGLLEHFDHSVKAPEQLSVGLTLPLFGVIPRIKRSALVDRGGHLWTPGAPGSVEADAYRNLRVSLLGATGLRGPIVTLLVTSAKAGEGKSTTALNLAATCARSGERTLLLDVDLRRPSLAEVFGDLALGLGLVDILRGDLPWQKVVLHTDIPNLDFIPTGDTFGVPIEVLGTRELRELMRGLSRHYDRVILDGPAVLGMADCRMLGRIVDAALMVVRSGAHDLRPLRRAKTMLEQSQVLIAGVVFNGLSEDLKNWSSYGTYGGYTETAAREFARPRGLPAPSAGIDETEHAEV